MSTSTPLTGLPPLLRAAGLTVLEVPGWERRSAGSYGPWLGILNHHTAGGISSSTLTPSLRICVDGRSDLPGPLCNLYGGRDRKLYMVAAGRANHAGVGALPGVPSGNGDLVGIEWENNGVGEPWDDLMPTMVATNAVICDYLGVPRSRCFDHREWAPTRKVDRAGINSDRFRGSVAAWKPTQEDDMPYSKDDLKAIISEAVRTAQIVGDDGQPHALATYLAKTAEHARITRDEVTQLRADLTALRNGITAKTQR